MLKVTNSAIKQLQILIGLETSPDTDLSFDHLDGSLPSYRKKFRLGVVGGGCSGFQYNFSLVDEMSDKDLLLTNPSSQLEILLDKKALDFVKGATLDYIIALGKRHFTVKNPNASSKCGCGSSFAI